MSQTEETNLVQQLVGEHGLKIRVELTENPLQTDQLMKWVSHGSCGAIAVFSGITRDNHEGKQVLQLEYEAYHSMALLEMIKIAEEAHRKWPDLYAMAISHRLGVVPIEQSSVLIVASSPHRTEALEAVYWGIDILKGTVPIWKQEVYTDGVRTWKENKECSHSHHSLTKTHHHHHSSDSSPSPSKSE